MIREIACGDIKNRVEYQFVKMNAHLIYLLVVLAIFGSTNGQNAPNIKNIGDCAILSDRDAMDGEIPYQVSIQEKSRYIEQPRHICGGSIIDEYHVLTAAHCVYGRYLPLHLIVAGTRNLSNPLDPIRVNLTIERAYMHADFEVGYFPNDIAIIRVSPGFPLDIPFIRPIALQTEQLKPPAMCTVTGWRVIQSNKKKYLDILQTLAVPLIKPEFCEITYKHVNFTSRMLCAGHFTGQCDICVGDSGGPLVCDGRLTGVISLGKNCALANNPGVYGNVFYYREWIEKTLIHSYGEIEQKKSSFQ